MVDLLTELYKKGYSKCDMDTNNSQDQKNLQKYDVNEFERPSVTVDLLLFSIIDNELKVLLIKRTIWPFEGMWALPGGFVQMDESLEAAATRKLEEEAGVSDLYLEQLCTFGEVERDPRTRVITVAYFALVPNGEITQCDNHQETKWFSIHKLPELAFDHKKIIAYAVDRLRGKIQYSTIAYGFLPEQFRLSELQKVHEIVTGEPIDKRNFRKKMLSLDFLEPTGKKELEGAHRPAMLYRFKKKSLVFFD